MPARWSGRCEAARGVRAALAAAASARRAPAGGGCVSARERPRARRRTPTARPGTRGRLSAREHDELQAPARFEQRRSEPSPTYSSPPPVSRGTRCRTLRPRRALQRSPSTASTRSTEVLRARDARALRRNHAAVDSRSSAAALVHALDRVRRAPPASPDWRDEAVHAVLDQLDRRVVLARHDDRRRAGRGGLDDDEPVALAARREGGGRAPGATRPRHLARRTKPGASTTSLEPARAICAQHARRAPARRRRSAPAAPGSARGRRATAGTTACARFSAMWRPAKTTTGSARRGVARGSSGPV